MEKSQRTYFEFEDTIRMELLRKLKNGELTEKEIIQLKKEKKLDETALQ